MNDDTFPQDALRLVVDPTPVEHVGGPHDGDSLPVDSNGCRRGGMYVVVNDAENKVIAKRFVPASGPSE